MSSREENRNSILPWLSLPLLLFLSFPLLTLVTRTPLHELGKNLYSPTALQAIQLSLITCSVTTLLTMILGTPIAYVLSRRQFPGRTIVDTLIDLPMILPPAVAGIALLMTFGRRGLLGSHLSDAGISIAFTEIAVILAQLFVSSPYYIKAATAGFSSVDRDLEQAAAVDGASIWKVFRYVTLPLASPSIIGGAFMTWARALGEFGATIIFAGNLPGRTQTMPLAIYIGFELDLEVAVTLATILLAVSFGILAVVKGALRREIA